MYPVNLQKLKYWVIILSMKKKQIVIIILLVVILLAFNKIFMNALNTANLKIDTTDIVNSEHISSQKLFEKCWKTVKKDYYDQSLNNQQWDRWKKHYKGKIKTEDDAVVAVNSMLASLN